MFSLFRTKEYTSEVLNPKLLKGKGVSPVALAWLIITIDHQCAHQ